MKLLGISNHSVAEVYDRLKNDYKIKILKDNVEKADILLCPSFRIFKHNKGALLKYKGIILLFENVLFLEELGIPVLDCETIYHTCYEKKALDYSEIEKAKDMKIDFKTLSNFVSLAPNESFCNELYYLLDTSSLGANRITFCRDFLKHILKGTLKKWNTDAYIKYELDSKLYSDFKKFLKTQKQFLKNCKCIQDMKDKKKFTGYKKFVNEAFPLPLYKWFFKSATTLNKKIVDWN